MHELDAALMAGHGFAVLALAYFGLRGLPSGLVDVPLEYFGTAIAFLQGLRQVRSGPVGVVGGSRGGEAALLIGATFPDVGTVVSKVGSGLVTQGIPRHSSLLRIIEDAKPSWTYGGKSLPYLPHTLTPEFLRKVGRGEPIKLGDTFRPDLAEPTLLEEVTIPVERTRGRILFITAGLDGGWPCLELCRFAMDRLDSSAYEHVHYEDAGHAIAPPPHTRVANEPTPGPGVQFAAGDAEPFATAAARDDAWRQTLRFFNENLGDS